MAEAKRIAARGRRRRLVLLRPEAVASGKVEAMAEHLSNLLRIDRASARGLLLRMQAPKAAA